MHNSFGIKANDRDTCAAADGDDVISNDNYVTLDKLALPLAAGHAACTHEPAALPSTNNGIQA
jgi:hypothetical protein